MEMAHRLARFSVGTSTLSNNRSNAIIHILALMREIGDTTACVYSLYLCVCVSVCVGCANKSRKQLAPCTLIEYPVINTEYIEQPLFPSIRMACASHDERRPFRPSSIRHKSQRPPHRRYDIQYY